MPCPYHLESLQELVGDNVFMLEKPSGRQFLSRRELYSRKKHMYFLVIAWRTLIAMPKTAAEWRQIVDNALAQSELNDCLTTEGN
jgi:hypothetical protein